MAKDRHLRNIRDREAGSGCHCDYPFCEYSEVTKLYVGNLPFSATEEGVRELFAPHGSVEKVSLITDRDTGRARGFGFVEMSNADASRAMQALNGKDFDGRALKVNEAQDRERSGGGASRGPRRY
jgi:RNA recognition motif-containing protein